MTAAATSAEGRVSRAARDVAIARTYRDGKSLRQVGRRFGLSLERIRQILKTRGEPVRAWGAWQKRKAA